MGSVLKALGLTIWGLIALGLLAIFIFVGYEIALKYRMPIDHAKKGELDAYGKTKPPAPAEQTPDGPNGSAAPRAPDETRKLLLSAAQSRQYGSAIAYGQQLLERNAAEASDLSIVAQSYLSLGDCADAQLFARKGQAAFRAAGQQPDDGLQRVTACCLPRHVKTQEVLDPALRARIVRLLNNTDAAKSDSGGPFVRLGELYYGFGEYEFAIVSIQLGLAKGKIAHLDEAYVYLGRAERALGDFDEARNAFNMLKNVPGISPRVLRLWTLYAETQLSASSQQSALENGSCPSNARANHDGGG